MNLKRLITPIPTLLGWFLAITWFLVFLFLVAGLVYRFRSSEPVPVEPPGEWVDYPIEAGCTYWSMNGSRWKHHPSCSNQLRHFQPITVGCLYWQGKDGRYTHYSSCTNHAPEPN